MSEAAQAPAQAPTDTASGYDPISFTALKVLQHRARNTTIPFAREMADAAGLPWRTSALRAWARRQVWGKVGAGYYLQLRHDAISAGLGALQRSAVLELGAGYGTRGIAEVSRREAYVESDLPNLIATKPALVEATLGGKPAANHHFLPFNVCDVAHARAVCDFVAGLRLREPLAVINEGILMYLDRDEQRAMRDNVKRVLARCAPGSAWITTDFSERDDDGPVVRRWMTRRLTRRIQRRFNRFRSDEEVAAFLAEGGLRGRKLESVAAQHPDRDVRAAAETFRAWFITIDPAASGA